MTALSQDLFAGNTVPHSGELNEKPGISVFKSACCNSEIVIGHGTRFPTCPNHPDTITLWKEIRDRSLPGSGQNKSQSA